jgi:hypothetical protein
MHLTLRLIPAAAAACLLASCGGGGGTAPEAFPAPPTASPSGGVAVDGYLSGATVLCDGNGNGRADTGELSVGTNTAGAFSFVNGCGAALLVSGGRSVDTGLPFVGVLRAAASSTVVSPLTTLMSGGASQAALLTAMGLPADTPSLLSTDPAARDAQGNLTRPDLQKATLVAQQLAQKLAEMFAGLGGASGADVTGPLYTSSANAMAGVMNGGAVLNAGGTVDISTLATLVAAGASAVTGSDAPASVKTAVAALNADALAQVAAVGLAAQAQALLSAAPADLTSTTSAQQSSTVVTNFIVANAAALVAPPGAVSAALAEQLDAIVNPPPTDYLALAGDGISLVNGADTRNYTLAQFQSGAGISVSWPLPSPMLLRFSAVEVGTYAIPANQRMTAAVEISETTANGRGKLLGYIENINVAKTAAGLTITVPGVAAGGSSVVYGMSSDGAKQAVIDFGGSVAGVTNTLATALGNVNTIVLGEVVNYAINRVSNDFTDIYSLRGKYSVKIVVTGVPLRQADGTALPEVTIEVPTSLNVNGTVATTRSVTGIGIVGHITLTD